MISEKEKDIFENRSVWEAVMHLALPTVLGQIILVIYNMADTFFVGLTKNDAMLSAVTVAMPAFLILSAISNLFGIGGASVISRALGAGDTERVREASAFAFWACAAGTVLYCLLCLLFLDPLVDLLGGAHPEVHRHAVSYMKACVIFGGLAASLSTLLSHLLRSEGKATLASTGIMLGGVLNIALDPLFMFRILAPGQEALGAAIATALSNLIALVYFAVVLWKLRNKTRLFFRPSARMFRHEIPQDIFSAGIPACMMTLCENISYAVLDKLMSLSGVEAQAGIGVAKKVNMLAHSIVRGIAQGALPLLAYNYAARRLERMKACFKAARLLAVVAASVCMGLSLCLARPLISLFIHSGSASLGFGTAFLRILCLGGPFSAAAYTAISFFQAVGEGRRSFLLAVLRKGLLDIPLMFVLGSLIPVYGIVIATPLTDLVCSIISVMLFNAYTQHLTHRAKKSGIVSSSAPIRAKEVL